MLICNNQTVSLIYWYLIMISIYITRKVQFYWKRGGGGDAKKIFAHNPVEAGGPLFCYYFIIRPAIFIMLVSYMETLRFTLNN